MTSSEKAKPTTLDALIPLIGDAVEHAQALQESAAQAVKGIGIAAGAVHAAVKGLDEAKQALAVAIATETKVQVKDALDDAADTMEAALKRARSAATQALNDVTTASNSAAGALRGVAREVDAMRRRHVMRGIVVGFLIGAVLSGAGVWAYLVNRDLHAVVTWITTRPR